MDEKEKLKIQIEAAKFEAERFRELAKEVEDLEVKASFEKRVTYEEELAKDIQEKLNKLGK